MAQISKDQAAKVVEAVLHRLGMCSCIPAGIDDLLNQTPTGEFVYQTPEGDIQISVHPNGRWEGHQYSEEYDASGDFQISGNQVTVTADQI